MLLRRVAVRPLGRFPSDSGKNFVHAATLRLFATRGFTAAQTKPSPTAWTLGFCLRSVPSVLLTTAPRINA